MANRILRHRRVSSSALPPLLILQLLIVSGCGPFPRFLGRMFDQIADPIETLPSRISNPILADVGLSILWIGHASVLIQIHDKVFITDPVFSNTVGMVSKRSIEPGLDPSSLSRVDFVLISHLHFDHFSYGSIDMLPKEGKLLLPEGGAEYSPDFAFAEIRELKPWDVLEEGGVRITAVPVQHFGGRYGFDIPWMQNRGYTGYVIEYRGTTVFVGGDTAYNPEYFKEIGRRFSIDLALLPISPVEPRDFMSRVHVDPKEAVQIFEDLRATLMIPIHHRTFFQGLEPRPNYAQELLEKIIEERNLQVKIQILKIGEQRILF